MAMCSLKNFSKLLSNSDAGTAVMEAKQEIIHKAIESQEVGWGALEIFLLKVCASFNSSRCKALSNTLNDIQQVLEQGFDDHILNDKNSLNSSVLRMYLAAEIYRQIGATLHYQVNIVGDRAMLILSGEQNNSNVSSFPGESEALSFELEIKREQATVLKILAGDMSLFDYNTSNPVATEKSINECFDFSQLTENQSKLLRKMALMEVADIKSILAAMQMTNEILNTTSTQIRHLQEKNSGMMQLDYKLFRDMYRNTENNELISYSDVLDVLPAYTKGVDKLERSTTLYRSQKLISKNISTTVNEINEIKDKIESLVDTKKHALKKQIYILAKELCSIIASERSLELSQEYNDSDECFRKIQEVLPGSIKRQFNNCLQACDNSKDKKSFDKAVKLASSFMMTVINTARKELKCKEKDINVLSKECARLKENMATHSNLIENLEKKCDELKQELAEKTELFDTCQYSLQQINENIHDLSKDFQQKWTARNLENEKIAELDIKLSDFRKQKESVEKEYIAVLQEKLHAQSQLIDSRNNTIAIRDSLTRDVHSVATKAISDTKFLQTNGLADIEEDLQDEIYTKYSAETLFVKENEFDGKLNEFIEWANINFDDNIFKDKMSFLDIIKQNGFIVSSNENGRLVFSINTESVTNFLDKYKKNIRTPHFLSLTSKHKDENESVRSTAIKNFNNILKEYISYQNFIENVRYSRTNVFLNKRNVIEMVIRTVVSMECELNDANENNENNENNGEIFFNDLDLPDNALQAIMGIRESYKIRLRDFNNTLNGYRSKIENLKRVLPNLMDYKVVDAEAGIVSFGKTKFDINNLHVELDKQAKDDILWVLNYIGNNHISVVNEHISQNLGTISNIRETLSQLKDQATQYDIWLGEFVKEYASKLSEIDNNLSSVKEEFDRHKAVQENLDRNMMALQANIECAKRNKAETEKQQSDFKQKIISLNREIEKKNQAILGQKTKRDNCEQLIKTLNEKYANLSPEIGTCRDKILRLEEDHKDKSKFDFYEDVQVQKLNNDLNLAYARVKFFKKAQQTMDIRSMKEWVDVGHIVDHREKEENTEYFSMFINGYLSENTSKEELMQMWANSEFNSIAPKFEHDNLPAGSRKSDDVIKNLTHVNGIEKLLDEIQADSFNKLIDIKDNELIHDVYNSLKTYCIQNSEPDVNFKSFSKYIGSKYNCLQHYSHYNVANKTTRKEIQEEIVKLEEELYKAQIVFGIYISIIISNDRLLGLFREGAFGLQFATRAEVLGRDLMHLVGGLIAPKIISSKYKVDDDKLNQLISQNKCEEESQKGNWVNGLMNWAMGNTDKHLIGEAMADFVLEFVKKQRPLVAHEMSTGRIIESQISEFAEPSLAPLLIYGIPRDVKEADFLLSLTDVCGGALMVNDHRTTLELTDPRYKDFAAKRADWVKEHPDYRKLISDTCNSLNLASKIKQRTTGFVSAVA